MTDILLTDVEMANIVFTDIISLSLKKINQKEVYIKDMQDVCDTLMECFDLYNAFVKEKNMNLPLIQESSYDMVVVLLNNAIGEMINGD